MLAMPFESSEVALSHFTAKFKKIGGTMKTIGYHRASHKSQKTDRGVYEIKQYCEANSMKLFKDKVYTDKSTGKDFNRTSYTIVKELLEPGDSLLITELDRLGRNKKETMKEIQYFRDNDIRLMVLELPTTLMDMSTLDNAMAQMLMEAINNMLLELYAAMAQAELEKKEKRQREGIEAKKRRGEWDDYGRPRCITPDEFTERYTLILKSAYEDFKNGIRKKRLSVKETSLLLGISPASYYRYKELADTKKVDTYYSEIAPIRNTYDSVAYEYFKQKYPKLRAEQIKRRSYENMKQLTTTEIMRQLKLKSGPFYRFKNKYEQELSQL